MVENVLLPQQCGSRSRLRLQWRGSVLQSRCGSVLVNRLVLDSCERHLRRSRNASLLGYTLNGGSFIRVQVHVSIFDADAVFFGTKSNEDVVNQDNGAK